MAHTREEFIRLTKEGRERAAAERAAGLRPPRKNSRSAAPSPAAVDVTQTDEFKAAVRASVDQAIKAILPTIAGMLPAQATSTEDRTDDTLSRLAMMIAELTDQGSQAPKRIPPEIILARKAAHDRMVALILKEQRAVKRDPNHEPPTFHLTSKIIARLDDAGEQLIEPLWRGADNRVYPTELGWLGIPNLAMKPQNASARAIMDAFEESIGSKAETMFKVLDDHPEPDEGIETEFGVTESGRLVTGGGVQHRKEDAGRVETVSVAMLTRAPDLARAGPGHDVGLATVRNAGASLRQQYGVAPYKDVRVLGSIVPPARQNG